jgi:hypothetical protein
MAYSALVGGKKEYANDGESCEKILRLNGTTPSKSNAKGSTRRILVSNAAESVLGLDAETSPKQPLENEGSFETGMNN